MLSLTLRVVIRTIISQKSTKSLSEKHARRGSPGPAEIGDRRSPPCLETFGRESGSVPPRRICDRRPATAGFRISSKSMDRKH